MPTFRTSSCKPIHPSVTLCVFTLLYALTAPLVEHIPNPMIPGAWLALNMIFPVLAGYFLGSLPGGIAGIVGTTLSALLWGSPFDAAAAIPHGIMGWTAGKLGDSGSPYPAAFALIAGHLLNLLFYIRIGLINADILANGSFWLGLATETSLGIITIILIASFLKPWLYHRA